MKPERPIFINGNDYRITCGNKLYVSENEIDRIRLRGTECTIMYDNLGDNWNVVPDRTLAKEDLRKLSFSTMSEAVREARRSYKVTT